LQGEHIDAELAQIVRVRERVYVAGVDEERTFTATAAKAAAEE
jgi:hypothetical protein